MKTVFLRLLEADDKAAALHEAIHDTRAAVRVEVDTADFAAVPGSPFAYWVPAGLRDAFRRYPPLKNARRFAARGPYTLDDFRFVRLAHEVAPNRIRNDRSETVGNRAWVRFLKGGAFSRYYSDPYLVLDWSDEGAALKALVSAYRDSKGWGPNWTAAINGYEYYFLPGLTWTHRTTRALSMRAMPAGCIFSAKGPALIIEDPGEQLSLLGLCNSKVFQATFEISLGAADAAARSYDVGIMQRLPIPTLDSNVGQVLRELAGASWRKRRIINCTATTSCGFALPALLQSVGSTLREREKAWVEYVRTLETELAIVQAQIDSCCFDLYAIEEPDRRLITGGGELAATAPGERTDFATESEADADDEGDPEIIADPSGLAEELAWWAVGTAFGRFDVRLATGARSMPKEPEPFDSLPTCSPGMLTGDDGLPLMLPPAGYPLAFPEHGILVDDPGHAWDLTVAVRNVFDVVFASEADCWWNDLAAQLDQKDRQLRGWLAGSFFEYHLKRYSKSRRKAPILWQLGTTSGRYSVWLYAHRISSDSFFQLQNDVVGPKLSHEERQLTNLMQSARDSPSVAERKAIAAQETFVEELRTMLEEIKRIAPLWTPNLDDGVVLTMAPLWRLVPQHKPWQQELKSKWNEFAGGAYDWANLAMHLWPERVVPRCTTDRSIAIAHGLEDSFWLEDFDNEWRAVQEPAQEREYVASCWDRSPRTKLLTQARALWAERYFSARRTDSDWWQEVEMGEHDDHPLAIRLWPRRVCESALSNPAIAKAHELNPPKLAAFTQEEAHPRIEAWLDKMSSRHGAAEIDRSFMSAAFGEPESLRQWKAWWAQLDDGQLDHLPVARYFRPEEVAKACQSTLDLANVHEVRRFFFIDTGSGLGKRLPPAEEILREVAERTSPAVKAALKSLVEAPGTVTRKKSARSRSRR